MASTSPLVPKNAAAVEAKMVSTCTSKVMGAVEARRDEDVLPVLEAYIKGQRFFKVYVDGGAQVGVVRR